jgi:hypothetical protein
MQIFGFEIKRKQTVNTVQSVVPPSYEDGSTVVSSTVNAGAYYGTTLDVEGTIKNENDLIRRYREISKYSDCDNAVEDIINEAIVFDEDKPAVDIVLDDLKVSESIKKKIRDEFANILKILQFSDKGQDIFRTWYVDGRLYYHIMIDENNPSAGILELRAVDPRKIRKIKNIIKDKTPNGAEVVKKVEEYYLFNDKGITEQSAQGIKLGVDSVIFVPSGIVDANTGLLLSHLHKAIKPVNQLKMIEDAVVIYRISRAPERRIFYIDVGNLPKIKAEQYVNDIMNRFRNKVVYDATTGEVRDDRKHMSMLEDFWMPRREGGKGTEITTLPGGANLGQIEDIQYFQNKLYQSLNVPVSRMKSEDGFNLGRSSEITRDEVKFSKFVNRLRKKFSVLFLDSLRVQLIAKGIINPDDWDDFRDVIRFNFSKDNYFSELKEAEILQSRLNTLQAIDPYVGKYYSIEWVKKNVLRMTDDDIESIESQKLKDRQDELEFAAHQGKMQAVQQAEMPTIDDQGNDNANQRSY